MSAVPSTFGKYFLTEKIATGGMAEIYLAKLLGPGGFEKFLIIKKIHPELSGERQFEEMFVAEAKTLVSLSHGNIVPIYELGMVDESYFIAMEYIDGPTLEELGGKLAGSRDSMTPAMAAYLVAELLKGLDYAHRKGAGVIHRDLSPRNVMISREGEVKLVDFGIAIARAVDTRAATLRGHPAGSYPHMSPEQVRGETLDPRSDVFAAGILLWELLAGRGLFARASDEETLAAVTGAPIDAPSLHCPKAAGVLDIICQKALARDLDERYQSAGEFLVAINRYLYSQMEAVTPADISRIVARHCPPNARRRISSAGLGTGESLPHPERSGTVPIERSGTVPIARSNDLPSPALEPRARSNPRPETVRSFATHVGFKEVLAAAQANSTGQPPLKATPKTTQKESRRGSLLLPGLAGALLALGAAAIAASVVGDSEAPARAELAGAPRDAGPLLAPLATLDAARAVPDASPTDAGHGAATVELQAIRKRRTDARPPAAMGHVRVGASPWADVYLDGVKIGRAPGNFAVPAGSHVLELRYKEQSKKIDIAVSAGALESVGLHAFDTE